MRKLFVASAAIFLFVAQTAYAAVSYSQQVTLEPGWNIVSTPRILESHTFSRAETLSNFSVFILDASRPSGWATMAEFGQTEFTPLFGYFINNKATTTQTLTFNYKASTTPNERLFERKFTKEGWYSFGIANPSYAKSQGSTTVDTNNPDPILNSLLGATSNYDSVVDFTDASFGTNPDSVGLKDPWNLKIRSADVSNTTEINSLNDFRETKGYAIYIKASSTLTGFQNSDVPQCIDGIDNDGDTKIDHLDFGCAWALDDDESNPPAGTITLTKSAAYANQSVAVPQTAYKIGEYHVVTSGDDMFAVGAIGLELIGSTTTISSLTDIYLFFDATSTPAYSEGTSTMYWIGEGETFAPNSSTTIEVYASLPLSIASTTIATQLIVAGVSYNSGDVLATDVVDGQMITATSTPPPPPAPPVDDDFGPLITSLSISPTSVATDGPVTFSVTAEDPTGIGNVIYDIRYPNSSYVLRPNCNFYGATSGTCVFTESVDHAMLPRVSGNYVIETVRAGDRSDNVTTYYPNGTVTGGESSVHNLTIPVIAVNVTPVPPSLTLAKYSAYANQTITVPQTAHKIGEYRLTGSAEGVNLDTITMTLATVGVLATSSDITNLYVVYGSKTTQIKSAGAASQTWSINEVLPANTTLNIAVYGTLASSIAGNSTLTSALLVSGTSQNSGAAVTSAVVSGQTIEIVTGSITAAVDASTPVSSLVVGGTMPKVGSFKFTALNEVFIIDELTTKVASAYDAAAIVELVFKDGATELKRQPMDGAIATATGLSISVGMNSSKVIDVYANLGEIGINAANTGTNVGVTLAGFESVNSNGVKTRTNTNLVGNNQYAYKTKPTITNVALPTTVLSGGTQTLYKFRVTAEVGGIVAWRKIALNIATSSPSSSFTVSDYKIYDAANESTQLSNVSSSNTGNVITFTSSVDQELSGSKTYVVKAVVTGTITTGASISTNFMSSGLGFVVPTDAATVQATSASFVWSDESIILHSGTTLDWNNDYLVKNLPTDSLTLIK